MKKTLLIGIVLALCAVAALRHFGGDFPWNADASNDGSGAIADVDRPVAHAVLPTVDGDWMDLANYKGKVVLVSFWTTWCPGCVDEVPALIRLQQEFGERRFTVVGIAVDDQGEESVESFVGKERFSVNGASVAINYPIAIANSDVLNELGFEGGLPAGVLLNRDGREVKMIRGTVGEAALSKAIRKLL